MPTRRINTLAKAVDEIGYKTLLKNQPAAIEAIIEALDKGGTAKQLERELNRKFGRNSLTALMAIDAAYHLERQRKENKK